MHKESMVLLEFEKIKEKLSGFALSEPGKKMIFELSPSMNRVVVESRQSETSEARAIIDRSSGIPLHSLTGIEAILEKPKKGMILTPDELSQVCGFLEECKKMKRFLTDKGYIAPTVSSYALSMIEQDDLTEEIRRCIRGGEVDDKASPELEKTRKMIIILEDRIKNRVESILKSPSYRLFLQDSLISTRQGRYVIPVKSEFRRNVKGQVLDTSASGSTVFIEPAEVSHIQDELNLLRVREEKEVYRVLASLTAMVHECRRELFINFEAMSQLDFAFAKGKFSKALGAAAVTVNTDGRLNIKEGKHPFLGSAAVPLSIVLGGEVRALVVTGPNTGGKTVALKTVGLLTLMVQAGLHVPVEKGSEFAIFDEILADIGDGQSIEQSLSTFSSHVRNIISILQRAGNRSLVILDELGAGTDPQEGTGLAIAVLERLFDAGATILATTHYSEIKTFAAGRPGYTVGSMEFDIKTLKPLYSLRIGEVGESNALLIALQLGMDKNIIERAHEVTYHERREYHSVDPVPATAAIEVPREEKAGNTRQKELGKKIKRVQKMKDNNAKCPFKVGDSVLISSMGRTGIVYEEINSRGEVGVMIMRQKFKVSYKRLSLHIEAEQLYPENYDMDIVLESKENRKKRKIMSKRHVEGLTITHPEKQDKRFY